MQTYKIQVTNSCSKPRLVECFDNLKLNDTLGSVGKDDMQRFLEERDKLLFYQESHSQESMVDIGDEYCEPKLG